MISLWMRRASDNVLLAPNVIVSTLEWHLGEGSFQVVRASGPLSNIDRNVFALDTRLEVRRGVYGGRAYLEGNTQFLLRYWKFYRTEQGMMWAIEAFSPEYIFTGRFVDYAASTEEVPNAYSKKTGAADDLIKAIVRENAGASTTEATRMIADYLTVDADVSLGATVDKGFSRREVFNVLNDLAADSTQQGTPIFWGLTADRDGAGFTFHTWKTCRGMDHRRGTKNEVVVSEAMGNLAEGEVYYDHVNEITAARAGGTGTGADRKTARVVDTARSTASPFAYREAFKDGTQTGNITLLTAEARTMLEEGRGVCGFAGRLVDTPYARYGERYGFGDLVTAEFEGRSFDCLVNSVSGRWSRESGEGLTIGLKGTAMV